MKQRIQKVLAAAGVASRRNVEQMVLEGRISVNGTVLRALPVLVDPQKDRIEVDHEVIKPASSPKHEEHVYVLMNKPKGVHCTNVAQGVQTRAIDLLGEDFPYRVFPVGRLDAESRGLLLLTNDGELTNQLTHPRYSVPKTYRAVVAGLLAPEEAERLQHGVWMASREGEGFRTTASHLRIVNRARDKTILEITLREGRNRQIRRMLAALGHKVRELTRISLGSLELKGLGPGQSRLLTDYEVRQLRKDIARAKEDSEARIARRKAKVAANAAEKAAGAAPAGRPARPAPAGPRPVAMRVLRPTQLVDDEDYVGLKGFPLAQGKSGGATGQPAAPRGKSQSAKGGFPGARGTFASAKGKPPFRGNRPQGGGHKHP